MPKRILVAEDDDAILDSISLILEYNGYEVLQTKDGSTVIDLLKKEPDLLLLDVWMSGADGTEICKKIKESDNLRHIPVVMISASRDLKRYALDAGANDYLEKPFDIDKLLKKVDENLQ